MAEPGATETAAEKLGRLARGIPETRSSTPAEKVGQAIAATQKRAQETYGGAKYPASSPLRKETPQVMTPEQEKWQRLAAGRRGGIASATTRTRIEAAKEETGR